MYNLYEKEGISIDEFIKILRYLENYVYRRAICGIPTNSLNKTFATFMKYIDQDNIVDSVNAHFLLLDTYKRFPTDEEFETEFVKKDLYNTRSIKYALDKLENLNRKEKVNVDDYTIEHIMPQNMNLSDEWKQELGPDWKKIQEIYLHTIGNLTLTGYNSELSDRPFYDKQTIEGGFNDSPIRLNQGLSNIEHWNRNEIEKRAKEIVEKAKHVWDIPVVDNKTLNKYRVKHLKQAGKIPHNLMDLIKNESSLVSAPTNNTYVRFKPKFLMDLQSDLIANGYISNDYDLQNGSLFWFEFEIGLNSIRFGFLIGHHKNQDARKRIHEVFSQFTHYFPNVDRKLRTYWHTCFSKTIVTSEDYEQLAEDDYTELYDFVEVNFRELIDNDLPKIKEAIYALVN